MTSESAVSLQIRHAAANLGYHLWRNNNGAFQPPGSDRWVRYGLANDSAKLNKNVKSSDLIGITRGIFTAIETKEPGWRLTPGDEHGQAQARFHDIVRAAGGYAGFACSVADYYRIINHPWEHL